MALVPVPQKAGSDVKPPMTPEPLNARQVLLLRKLEKEKEARNSATGILLRHAAFLGTPKLSALLGPTRRADPNKPDSSGWSPLHYACANGKVDSVRALLRRHADPDTTTSKGWTPLHVASFHGHEACILVLLDHAASRTMKTTCGDKPLTAYDLAEKWGHTSVMRLLTSWEPPEPDTEDEDEVNSVNSHNTRQSMISFKSMHQNSDSDDNDNGSLGSNSPINKGKKPPLNWAQKQQKMKEKEERRLQRIKEREEREKEIREKKQRDKKMGKGIPGSEYEKLKIRRRHQRFADRLFKFTHPHQEVYEEEMDETNHVHYEGDEKETFASKMKKNKAHLKLIKTLNVVNKDNRVIRKKLKKKGKETTEPGSRTQTAQQKQFVLEDALRKATLQEDIEEMKRYILFHNFDVDAPDPLKGNVTALHLACQKPNIEVVRTLLDDGQASLECVNIFGDTPLHFAAERGFFDIIQLLLIAGANPDALNKYGESCIDIALVQGHTAAIELLSIYSRSKGDNDDNSTSSSHSSKAKANTHIAFGSTKAAAKFNRSHSKGKQLLLKQQQTKQKEDSSSTSNGSGAGGKLTLETDNLGSPMRLVPISTSPIKTPTPSKNEQHHHQSSAIHAQSLFPALSM